MPLPDVVEMFHFSPAVVLTAAYYIYLSFMTLSAIALIVLGIVRRRRPYDCTLSFITGWVASLVALGIILALYSAYAVHHDRHRQPREDPSAFSRLDRPDRFQLPPREAAYFSNLH